MESWPATTIDSIVAYNYSFTRTDENADTSSWEPYWTDGYRAWFKDEPRSSWLLPSLVDILRGEECEATGVFGTTEKQESLVALEYFDKTEKTEASKAHGWGMTGDGDPLDALDGGNRMTKGGLL